jgi:hypothetical protein
MTHNDIILELYQFRIPERYAGLVDKDIRGDYVQYCYIALYDIPIERLEGLRQRGKLRGYFTRLCYRQAFSRKSKFYKLYGQLFDDSRFERFGDNAKITKTD